MNGVLMKNETINSLKPAPVVFCSYAHETLEHNAWVKSLGEKLRADGVDLLLDVFHLGLGDDLMLFMENISESNRVILVCTPTYATKANTGKGGVGYERSVITSELAKKIDTNKFVCILRSGDADKSIPIFAKSKLFVDFRDELKFQDSYDELLSDLHDANTNREPVLGPNRFEVSNEKESASTSATSNGFTIQRVKYSTDLLDKAEIILQARNRMEWKKLLLETRKNFVNNICTWRSTAEARNPSDYTREEIFESGVDICEPMLKLSISAAYSELPEFQNQIEFIDDLRNIEGWQVYGCTLLISMPDALAYIYHHLLGSMLIESDQHLRAVELLTCTFTERRYQETVPLWQESQMMGWVDFLDGNCITSWKYMTSIFIKRTWLDRFFLSQKQFIEGYRAYCALASVIELASTLGSSQSIQQHPVQSHAVPTTFLHPIDQNGADYSRVLSKAIPAIDILETIALRSKTTVAAIHDAWNDWYLSCVRRLGEYHYGSLSRKLSRTAAPSLPHITTR